MSPLGLLVDYGDTLAREVIVNLRAGNEWLLRKASYIPPGTSLEDVMTRASQVTTELAPLRDILNVETPWSSVTRLIHDYLGVQFRDPMPELELGFWNASVQTMAVPGSRTALAEIHRLGIKIGVVSNCGFSEEVVRHELSKHGLTEHLQFVMTSAAYLVRKPNPLLFHVAAARLGFAPESIWHVGDMIDTDVRGARASGMTAVWLRPNDQSEEPKVQPHVTATSWDDVVRKVRAARAENAS